MAESRPWHTRKSPSRASYWTARTHASLASKDSEIIQALLGKAPHKFLNLARDIVEENGLSPIDIPYVISKGKAFIVVEGNRRVATLKVLAKPDLVKDSAVEGDFKELAADFSPPTQLFCAIASSREEAAHWIELRHTGENAGAGVVDWSPAMRERFKRTPGSHSGRALTLLDDLEKAFGGDPALQTLIDSVRENQLTVLGRLVSDPAIGKRLGIAFTEGATQSFFSTESLQPAVERILGDVSEAIVTSRTLNSKEERAAYVESIAADLPDPDEREATSRPLGELPPPRAKTPKKPKSGRRKPESPYVLKGLDLAAFPAGKVDALAREIQRLRVDNFPYSIAVLLRVVIELAVYDFAGKKGWTGLNNLKSHIQKCALFIDSSQSDDRLTGVRTGLADGTSVLAVKTIQGYLHNPHFHASPADLRAIAANYSFLLQELNNSLAESGKGK